MADRDILPDNFKPVHYDLVLTDLDFDSWSYKGTVTIEGELVKPAKEIVLNILKLTLASAKVTAGDQSWDATSLTDDSQKQRATLAFAEELPIAPKASLVVEFTGEINHDFAGFYRSQYKPAAPAAASVPRDSQYHYMLSTQFEACDARRAFPCFDEPSLKATFDLALEVPDDQVALANMPVKETKETKPGKKLVSFERTPVMSTYLLAWAVGDFEYIEAFTDREYDGKKLPVRVYTTRGLKEQGQWALQHAPKIIDFFSEQFDLDYPLPKSDILAVHEFTHGAMENWGLVTYRMTAILFDEERSDVLYRVRIAYVVAHELAHQWFGNLVTMDWWDELWLNEGFATWAGWLAVDHLHPDWEVWAKFTAEGMNSAFGLDAVRASHPIQVPVRDALEVNQIFDMISYLKGCSMIRMLASHVSIPSFLKGVSIYLKKHAYGNAKTTNLWAGISEASGLDVAALMGAWIEKIGYPVLDVTEGDGSVTLKQSRFLSSGDVQPEDDTTTWWLPLALRGKTGVQGVAPLAVTTREETIDGVDGDFYLLNAGATGFYRINYPPSRLTALGTQLDQLSAEDKVFIIGSAADLAFSGHGSSAALLSFVRGLKDEGHLLVMSQAMNSVGELKSIFGGDPKIKKGLEKFTLQLIQPQLDKLGWEPVAGEEFNTALLRKRLLENATQNNHEAIIAHGAKIFADSVADPENKPVPADLRRAVYLAALHAEPASTAAELKKLWYTTSLVDVKETVMLLLGYVPDATVISSLLLPFFISSHPPAPAEDCVAMSDMGFVAASMAANLVARPLLWAYLRDNWDKLLAKLGGNVILVERVIAGALNKFTDLETLAEIDTFFGTVDTKGFDRTLNKAKDIIRTRAAYRARDAQALAEWLEQNGY
ncbi:hypothetical protein GQ53DRAFT_365934 [Thozetella sp. PMI_491]|nr:hypothetical protein GQ53DRAFT_365934 [Thozetella sp. PMI_491]